MNKEEILLEKAKDSQRIYDYLSKLLNVSIKDLLIDNRNSISN